MPEEYHQFDIPVQIYTRHAFAKLIWTVPQAIAFLSVCQKRHHNAEFYVALTACRAAIQREAPASCAREAFCRFAEHGSMLIGDVRDEDAVADEPVLRDERVAA